MADVADDRPTNPLVGALLNDLYQLTMTYAHWKTGKHNESGVFELFFRKNPFGGEFTVFCGLDECLKHFQSFSFSQDDIDYLQSTPALAHCEAGFFDYLLHLDTSQLTVRAIPQGSVVFPRVPLIIVEAPLGLGQLLETTLLNLVNYASLTATNAARMVLRAKPHPCIEFGLRRAPGPDGACSASKYAYIGGFVATSNVQAGKLFGIPIAGTHAHSYVQAFASLGEIRDIQLHNKVTGVTEAFLPHVLRHRKPDSKTNEGELAAFVAYACAFPDSCLCLIDTYDTLQSGLPNFVAVALALDEFGYTPKGIRLDSGDLASLSLQCTQVFQEAKAASQRTFFDSLTVVVSNDINESILHKLSQQPHGITAFGIGTNLVTNQAQPALGCVYKLVEWNGMPRIKVSQDLPKTTIPGKKRVFRLFGNNNDCTESESSRPILDLMTMADEPAPQENVPVLCRHPFDRWNRCQVKPTLVMELHSVVFSEGQQCNVVPNRLEASRSRLMKELDSVTPRLTSDGTRQGSYEVMVSNRLFQSIYEMWEAETPVESRS